MITTAAACLPPGAGGDPVGELHRQAALVADLGHRLESVVRALPRNDFASPWRGAGRDALQRTVDIERARLSREVSRLEGVRIQLDHEAQQAAIVAASVTTP